MKSKTHEYKRSKNGKMNANKFIKAIIATSVILSGLLFSSYAPLATAKSTAFHKNWEEYNKVQNYVWENACTPISNTLKKKYPGDPKAMFSRCSSGYDSQFVTLADSVKTTSFVNGKIVYNRGCSPVYVCDFKVCVSSGFIMLRSKGHKDYQSVNAWIREKNGPPKVHEHSKEIKS